jgi:hypothetical protein
MNSVCVLASHACPTTVVVVVVGIVVVDDSVVDRERDGIDGEVVADTVTDPPDDDAGDVGSDDGNGGNVTKLNAFDAEDVDDDDDDVDEVGDDGREFILGGNGKNDDGNALARSPSAPPGNDTNGTGAPSDENNIDEDGNTFNDE